MSSFDDPWRPHATSALTDEQREWGPDPMDRTDLSLADRFDLFHRSHPTQFCRRDRAAIMAALLEIDALRREVHRLAAEIGPAQEEGATG